jgi:hypothetical protein
MLMVKSKGGRGVSAPYQTTHIRVPVPLKGDVYELIEKWHISQALGESEEDSKELKESTGYPLDDLDLVIAIAEQILKKRKSAKVSIELLLRAVFGEEINL